MFYINLICLFYKSNCNWFYFVKNNDRNNVQRHRALYEYGAINMLYFIIIIIR